MGERRTPSMHPKTGERKKKSVNRVVIERLLNSTNNWEKQFQIIFWRKKKKKKEINKKNV